MPEEVLFKREQKESLGNVAAYLRSVADKLDAGEPITFEGGGDSVTMDPPQQVEFEVKCEREGPTDGRGELSIELELEWDEGASGGDGGDAGLSIN